MAASKSTVVTVFRATAMPGDAVEDELNALGERMYVLATQMPGFISYKDYVAADGESVSIVEFETMADVEAWRDHPEHKQAQQRGREAMFASYHIQVCETVRDYSFEKP